MDLNTACEIIGVKEDCSMEELIEQYYALTEKRLSPEELEDVQNAYNVLRDHIETTTPPPKLSFKEKFNNFFYHYKVHFFGGILLFAILGLLGYQIVNSQIEKIKESKLPPPAVEIMLFGDYNEHTDLTPIEEAIDEAFPEWDRVKISVVYSPANLETELAFAAMQKSVAVLATERPDIYIFDSEHLEGFIADAPLVRLNQFENEENTEDKWVMYQQENDDQEYIYGIDITDSELFADSEVANESKIAVIREDSENIDNSIEFILRSIK